MPSIPSALDITRDIVRMDTRNPPGREVECAHYLGDLLSAAGNRGLLLRVRAGADEPGCGAAG